MNKTLKEMLLQHKPITEQTFDIEAMGGESFEKERESDGHTPESIASLHNVSVEDILDQIEEGIKVEREHTSDEAEARLVAMDHLVELPDYYTRLDKMEEEGEKDLEEVTEDVPVEENNHTIADAIEEAWLPVLKPFLNYHNSRIKANTKKGNKNQDKLEKEKAKGEDADAATIKKLEAKVAKNAAKIDSHSGKYNNTHNEIFQRVADKVLSKPGYLEKMIRDPRKLRKIPKPSLFAAQVENRAKSYNQTSSNLVKTATERRDDLSAKSKQLQQAGKTPEHKEEPKVAPKAMPTTKVAPTAPTTDPAPHQRIANDAAAFRERISKVKSIM